jgi:NAD(P) transhydrogenase
MDAIKKYDLIVIGSGPAGEKAAVKAAYFGHSVALVEKEPKYGGAEVVTGTLPSKTLKETSLYYSGKYDTGLYGVDRQLKHQASIDDFMYRKNFVTNEAAEEIETNLYRHAVDIYHGVGSFEDPHTIKVKRDKEELIYGEYILIATGSYPYHPPQIPFDGVRVHDSDTILQIKQFPKSIIIIGAGVIGCEYTTIFATMGTAVALVNDKEQILPFIDQELSYTLVESLRKADVNILFNATLSSVETPQDPVQPIKVKLSNGVQLEAEMFLFAAGRSGNTKLLNLEKAGLEIAKREQIAVDDKYRTKVPHIFAVGDVIGFPALASTSMDQGRVAIAHMFHTKDLEHLPLYFPYGIYTIPEVSMAGITEEQAKEKSLSYCVGKARYADMARGQIIGAKSGFLKLIFQRDTLVIIGVHIIGRLATEIIHFGLMLVEDKKTLYHIIGTIFNYPTLHDLYKYAAYDGLSNLTGRKVKP